MAIFENGFQYKNTFATTPLCCPARAAILSGCYGHNTGVYSNGGKYGGWEHFRDNEPTALPARLKNAGYRTFLGGKYLNAHHSDSPLPVGWTDGAVLSSPNLQKYRGYDYELLNWTGTQRWLERKGKRPEDYSTDVIKFKTLEFLNRAKNENDGQPFFALVAPTCPHLPLPPAPRHRNSAAQWGARTFPTQRANYYTDNGFEDKPSWLQDTLRKRHRLKSWGARVLKAMGGDLPPDTDRLDEMLSRFFVAHRGIVGEFDHFVGIGISQESWGLRQIPIAGFDHGLKIELHLQDLAVQFRHCSIS
jgi:arylsulfatase A-like enzyme